MRVRALALGSILFVGTFPALGDPAAPALDSGLLPWSAAVRGRVTTALASMRRTTARERIRIGFKVTETGDIVEVHVEGAPRTAARATAILQALARVPPPPDDRAHEVSVNVMFH